MKDIIVGFRLFLVLTVLTGIVYPLVVTGVAQSAFRSQANGSMIEVGGRVVGSALVGQSFSDPKYFWGRPSATAPMPYNASASSGSNLGPTNAALIGDQENKGAIKERIEALIAADPGAKEPIPTDLVTASASGLDPHISIAAARYQAHRIATRRQISQDQIEQLIVRHSEPRTLGILGEPVVNVLKLNLELDQMGR